MLVLSRREKQRIQFPTLGIAVEVVQVKGRAVRLGIEAPADIPVLRQELVPEFSSPRPQTSPVPGQSPSNQSPSKEAEIVHKLRGRINVAVMGLHLVAKQLERGLACDAEATLQSALQELESIDSLLSDRQPKIKPGVKPLEALVVEDNLNEELLLRSYLQMSGVHVNAVHDGDEALNYLSTHERPDFILLDMHLPKVDGPTTLSRIRQDPAFRGMRVFAVTGSSPEEMGFLKGDLAVDAWFTKPINPSHIVEAMLQTASTDPACSAPTA